MPTGPQVPDIAADSPNAARMYDYFLGGSHNFAVDRAAGDAVKQIVPGLVELARANRHFLRRAVRYCQEQGIDQFLDLGSGIPTVGNVHEVARSTDPTARVAYVDNEPVAVATCRAVLGDDPLSTITEADLRDPDAVLGAPEVTGLLDFSRPVALLTVAVLHFVPDSDRPREVLDRYRGVLAPGSVHVLSHATVDFDEEAGAAVAARYVSTSSPLTPRTRAQVVELMGGSVELVDPGVVVATRWRPTEEETLANPGVYAAVGRIVGR